MLKALTSYRCPHCEARFALEIDEGQKEINAPGCPICGWDWEQMVLLPPAEREAWMLWRQLALHAEGLPLELRLPLGPRNRGLLRVNCLECGTGSWLPPSAAHCPMCRAEVGLDLRKTA